MNQKRILVKLGGVIVGAGFACNCIVEGEQIRRPYEAPKLSHFDVIWVQSTPLSEGIFSLFVGGENFKIQYKEGAWMTPEVYA